jgi:hypothetical protein
MTYATTRTRVILVLLMAFGLILGSLAAPAAATGDGEGGGDDLDTVRAQTLSTIDYKIGLLTNLKNETDNNDRKGVYDGGIARLRELRGSAESSTSVDNLRAMDAQAHTIYHETNAEAATADQSPDTAEAVAKAGAKVMSAIENVEKAAETGSRLDSSWADLKDSVNAFRKALAAHVVAVTGGPGCVNGWNLPG